MSTVLRHLEPLYWISFHLDTTRIPRKTGNTSQYHIEAILRLETEDRSASAWQNLFYSGKEQTHFSTLLVGKLKFHILFGLL